MTHAFCNENAKNLWWFTKSANNIIHSSEKSDRRAMRFLWPRASIRRLNFLSSPEFAVTVLKWEILTISSRSWREVDLSKFSACRPDLNSFWFISWIRKFNGNCKFCELATFQLHWQLLKKRKYYDFCTYRSNPYRLGMTKYQSWPKITRRGCALDCCLVPKPIYCDMIWTILARFNLLFSEQ